MREEREALVFDPLPASPKFAEFGGRAALAAVGIGFDFVFGLGMRLL